MSVDGHTGWTVIPAVKKFQILTCTRLGEVRGQKKQEFDLESRVWAIPAERMRMRREQNVSLSRQAGDIEMEHRSEIDAVNLRFQSLVSAP